MKRADIFDLDGQLVKSIEYKRHEFTQTETIFLNDKAVGSNILTPVLSIPRGVFVVDFDVKQEQSINIPIEITLDFAGLKFSADEEQ